MTCVVRSNDDAERDGDFVVARPCFHTGESAAGFCVLVPYPPELWEKRISWHSLAAFAFGRLKPVMCITITAGGTAAGAVGIKLMMASCRFSVAAMCSE